MISKALDLLRTLGWLLLEFIYNLIDSLFDILKELNGFNIIDSISNNTIFQNFHTGVLAISLTVLGLFAIWKFVMKMLEPDEGLNVGGIVKEIIKCTCFILLSTFLFAQASVFSIKLSGYTATALSPRKVSVGDNMLSMYVDYTDEYKANSDFEKEDYAKYIADGKFKMKEMYNDKFITDWDSEDPNEEKYMYEIDWIMATIVGAFFLYAIFFSGMMLARRQIEFLFLFIISPVIYATSIGNKQRRGALIEQLVSLMLQGAVIMLIITLTGLVMGQINETTFFTDSVIKNTLVKSFMFLGCASFLLTGSQVVNRFIGNNVSANSGREQMMAMMGFGQAMGGVSKTAGMAMAGAGGVAGGVLAGGLGKAGGNKVSEKVGNAIQKFGEKIKSSESGNKVSQSIKSSIGNTIEKFGGGIKNNNPSSVGKKMRDFGKNNFSNIAGNVNPLKNNYRKRYGKKGE